MQVTDKNGNIFGPHGLQVNGPDGKPKVISSGGGGGSIPHGTASGTDTYTVSITGVTAYNDGDSYLVRFTNGNTTGCTLNINGLGANILYRNNDGELIGGDIIDGAEMLCIYNSTISGFQVIGTAPNTLLAYVTNAESITINKGQPVYAFGGQGDRLKVKLAYNTSDATSAQTVGLVVSSSIGANQKGLIMLNGQLDGLSIFPTSTWADGDPVYLGATAGSITKIKPHAPNHLVYLGFVTTANNGSAGRMYVRVQNGYELDELHDVQISGLADNDLLQYDLATDLWQNKSLSSAGIQPTLVSSTNIKTVNGNSLLGSGNLTISGGGLQGINNLIKARIGDSTSAHVTTSPLASLTLFNTRLYANPFISAYTITSSLLYVNCVTSQVGALGRILIYSDLNGLPDTKLFESANIDLSSTGIKSVITAQTFNASTTYWLSFHSSGTATISGIPASAVMPLRVSGINISSLLFTTATFGLAPSPFGAVQYTNTAVPFIGITL